MFIQLSSNSKQKLTFYQCCSQPRMFQSLSTRAATQTERMAGSGSQLSIWPLKLRDNPARAALCLLAPACLQDHPIQDDRLFPEHSQDLVPHCHPMDTLKQLPSSPFRCFHSPEGGEDNHCNAHLAGVFELS